MFGAIGETMLRYLHLKIQVEMVILIEESVTLLIHKQGTLNFGTFLDMIPRKYT